MIRVSRVSVSDHLAINPRTPFFGVLQFFEKNDAGTFAHHKPIPSDIKRA
jgi:hypothetical protein